MPAAVSLVLPNGEAVLGVFSTPEEASQSLSLEDLTVSVAGQPYTEADFAGTPSAEYEYGELVGITVTVNTSSPSAYTQVAIAGSLVSVTVPPLGQVIETNSVPVYDAADTAVTFTLSDGAAGSISYEVPWEDVDPEEASQSLPLSNFKLNLAGRVLTPTTANFTTSPSIQFENGEFVGITFAINTSEIAGYAYSSVSMSELAVAAVDAATSQVADATAAVKRPALVVDFSTYASPAAHQLLVGVKLQGADTIAETLNIPANATPSDVRALVFSVLQDNGLDVTLLDGNMLLVKGTKTSELTRVDFSVLNPPAGWAGPSLRLRIASADITPKMYVNDVEVTLP